MCWLSTNAPHGPLQVRPEDEARYAGKVPENTAKYFGMIANIDDNIARALTRARAKIRSMSQRALRYRGSVRHSPQPESNNPPVDLLLAAD